MCFRGHGKSHNLRQTNNADLQAREDLGFKPEDFGLNYQEASNIAYAFAVSVCTVGFAFICAEYIEVLNSS